MLRLIITYITLTISLAISTFFGEDVSFTVNIPENVDAGKEFRVQITINKGTLTSFARFQQELPAGLTAVPVNSANAVDFTFEDNRIRIIWLKLPEEPEFTFSYKIRVDERLKGEFDLAGSFSYIKDNERKTASLVPELLAITPSPNIDPALIVDIRDFEKLVIPDLTPKADLNIACIRQRPYLVDNMGEYQVHLLINKQNLNQFAKIEENIPYGYKAVKIDTRDGIFTHKDDMAKIIWRNLPSEEHYVISYKLIPIPGIEPAPLNLKGTFSYYEDDKTETINIVERDLDLLALNETEVHDLLKSISEEDIQMAQSTFDYTPSNVIGNTDANNNNYADYSNTGSENSEISSGQSGISDVYYRVQIAAGHKPVNIKRYFNKYNLEQDVIKELHEGWNKYLIGRFEIYKDARDYRVHVWNTTIIDDAFVTAYNAGSRITVQEALMIANQKWYK